MADEKAPDDAPPKKSRMALIIGLALALLGGGGGFYASWSGMILGSGGATQAGAGKKTEKNPFVGITFVEIQPMIISVNASPERRMLRFRAQLEVPLSHREDVTKMLPRVVDVLNSYLRALEVTDLENQAALTRLRAQMLRRVQVVTGQDRVSDFLIMEFVLT